MKILSMGFRRSYSLISYELEFQKSEAVNYLAEFFKEEKLTDGFLSNNPNKFSQKGIKVKTPSSLIANS